ncbi:MAG TPA: hypothetical protein VGL56_11960 [Fimbriimonadaceae bacterium]|jgi:hypothetical protein
MIANIVALVAFSASPVGLDDWQRVDNVRAAGFEQVAGGKPHPFTVVRSRDSFLYNFSRDIDGQLAGALRTELGTPKGVFTWLAGDPHFVLRLPYPSAPEFVEALLPVRFKRKEVFQSPGDVERRMQKKVQKQGEQDVASHDCLVLSFSDRTPLVQTLWVDEATGFALKQEDSVSKQVVYDRTLTNFDPISAFEAGTFEFPQNSVVIRGFVSPQILAWANMRHGPQQYQSDIAILKATSGIESGLWIHQMIVPPNFEYMGTRHFQELRSEEPPVADSGLPAGPAQSFASFGGIPAGWSEVGQVVLRPEGIFFGFSGIPDSQPRGLFLGAQDPDAAAALQQPILPSSYFGPDGHVYRLDQGEQNGTSQGQENGSVEQNASPPDSSQSSVRSEFLDKKTGDTLTILQLRNVSLRDAFLGSRIIGPNKLVSQRYKEMNAFELRDPVAMKAVEWRDGATDYVVVSTVLDYTALQSIAERI